MGLEALERMEALVGRSAGLRDKVREMAQAGTLPNQHLLPMSASQIDAALAGKRDQVAEQLAGTESVGSADRAMLGLEAIVQQVGRPSLLVQDGKIVAEGKMDGFPGDLSGRLSLAEGLVGRVGRVELINHRMEWAGTGWAIEKKGLIITNRHVAEFFAGRKGPRGYAFLVSPASGDRYGARLDFLQEYDRAKTQRIDAATIRYVAGPGEPDIALIELEDDASLPEPIDLASAESAKDALVSAIGYPAYDSRNNDQDIAHYFGDIFNRKRFAPGFVTQAPDGTARLMHDCTTLGGNSGSVLLDLETGKAVGLHFAGSYREGNFAVSVKNIQAALRGERSMVSLALEAKVERPDGEHEAGHFDGRTGYDENFLADSDGLEAERAGFVVPLPVLSNAALADAAHIADADGQDAHVIPYQHFSVVFSKSRRVPRFTAVNVDGAQSRRIKRSGDQWFADLRLPRNIQLNREDYGHPEIDRGHMVRREDPNWGTQAEALLGNSDSFHYTNAAPQHARLNQNKQAWLGLEEYVLGNARTHGLRAVVFTGPVLRRGDPVLEGTDVKMPQEFWKVVVMVDVDRNKLHATGYVLGQGELIRDITEGFVFGEFGTYQVRIADIQRATGLDFGALTSADPFERRSRQEEAAGGLLMSLPLSVVEDAYMG